MIFSLDQKHIDYGMTNDAQSCPIALCLRENIEEIKDYICEKDEKIRIAVYQNSIWIGHYGFEPSDGIRSWIDTFDTNRESSKEVKLKMSGHRISLAEEIRK